MIEQINLFQENYTDIHLKNGFKFSYPDIKDVTFLGGKNEAIHRWFRLTPSYSPEFVRYAFNELDCGEDTLILDPFLGKGTTIIECKKYDYPCVGVELNPLLKMVCQRSLQWKYSLKSVEDLRSEVMAIIKNDIRKYASATCEEFCSKQNIKIPMIYDPFRWWKNVVLKELLIIRKAINENVPEKNLNPFWMALCVSALDCANIHRNHPTISFDDNHSRDIDPLKDFEEKIDAILEDLKKVKEIKNKNRFLIHQGDSTALKGVLGDIKIDRVITSPPYPNRFSYVHTTRPQLYFMEILEDVASATEIDLRAVGGTWGRATSVLMKEEIPPNKGTEDILCFRKQLLKESLLMCNYATKYFNMMHNHIRCLRQCISADFRGVYLVGNSRLKGIEIYTELYLAKIFEIEGFKVDEIKIFRKRGGKRALYESAVCVSKKT